MFATLTSSAGKPSGQARVKFLVELGQHWEWHVFNHMLEVKEKDRIDKFKRKLFKKSNAQRPAAVTYPIHIVLSNISVVNLFHAHLLVKNSPQVHVECGSFVESTCEREQGGDTAHWRDLRWHIYMMSERANIIFVVTSGKSTIGRFAISGKVIAALPRSKTGRFQVLIFNLFASKFF